MRKQIKIYILNTYSGMFRCLIYEQILLGHNIEFHKEV